MFNKKIASEIAVGVILLVAIAIGGIFWWQNKSLVTSEPLRQSSSEASKGQGTENNEQKACTMEVKLCDDGSYVSRTGPNCEFASCPGNNNQDSNQQQIVGGDKDEHDCIASAGYSWCEEKQKCLRSWEEECEKIYQREDFKEGWSIYPDPAKRKEGIITEPDGTTFSVWKNRINIHILSGVKPEIVNEIFKKISELGGEVIGGDYDLQNLIIKTSDEVRFKVEMKKSNLPIIVTYDLVLSVGI